MPKRQINLSLDFSRKDNFLKFEVKQFDSLTLNITPLENGVAYSTANCTAKLYVGCYDELYEQETDITVNDNSIVINVDNNILNKKCATAYAEIELTDNLGVVTSSTFIFSIVEKIGEGANIPGQIDGFVAKYEKLIAEFKNQVNNSISDNQNKTQECINTLNTNVANTLKNFDNTSNNKLNDIEVRFQRLTTSQQQDSEVIDARDGEISLHARLERDLAKGKIIEEKSEGTYITVKESVVGDITDIEILGNTTQDPLNLADIQSVGELQEDGRYKMSILSCGKNLFDGKLFLNKGIDTVNGIISDSSEYHISDFIKIKPNTRYIRSQGATFYYYDKDFNYISFLAQDVDSPSNARYLRMQVLQTWDLDEFQLEEGRLSTLYEPYHESISKIILPCQLEKVGDVADRLFRREDGVWCIEKNIGNTIIKTESLSLFTYNIGSNNRVQYYVENIFINALTNASTVNNINSYCKNIASNNRGNGSGIECWTSTTVAFVCDITDFPTSSVFKSQLPSEITFKYVLATPEIIELPLDTQITLNSFNGVTNIFTEDTVIEPTIKATVPKSLGASVNSLANKTDNLSQRIENVEKLKEGSELEVTTDKGYVMCENSNNGQIEELKIEGKTLVNLAKQRYEFTNMGVSIGDSSLAKTSTLYTVKYTVKQMPSNSTGLYMDVFGTLDKSLGTHIKTVTTKSSFGTTAYNIYCTGVTSSDTTIIEDVIILEGDHTQNPPEYFEGLKSVGDGVDKIEVLSRKEDGNLNSNKSYIKGTLDNNSHVSTNRGIYGELYIEVSPNTTYRVTAITSATIETYKTMLCNASKNFIKVEWERTFTTPSNCRYVRVGVMTTTDVTSDQANSFKMQLEEGTDNTTYKECIQNKKQILYQTKEGNYEKPILRKAGSVVDSIEKHSDGKYYYHKRCEQRVYQANDETKSDVITDKTNTVYKLAKEEVYECVNLDLESYEGETSVICNTIIPPSKLSFKVASHIANTVAVLKDKINYLEDKLNNMLKLVLAGNFQVIAYELYPEDFKENITDETELSE